MVLHAAAAAAHAASHAPFLPSLHIHPCSHAHPAPAAAAADLVTVLGRRMNVQKRDAACVPGSPLGGLAQRCVVVHAQVLAQPQQRIARAGRRGRLHGCGGVLGFSACTHV